MAPVSQNQPLGRVVVRLDDQLVRKKTWLHPEIRPRGRQFLATHCRRSAFVSGVIGATMSTVYLNGAFLPIEQACVPVTDRGFLFGDGVYEVIPAYGGKPLQLPHHLQRLQNSLDGIRLANPLSHAQWTEIFNQLLQSNRDRAGPDNDQSIYLQVTRGPAPKRDHSFPAQVTPTVYVAANPLPAADPDIAARGIAAVTLDDIRWQWCDIKAITLLANVLMRQRAAEQDAAEALLIRNGLLIEGSSSNVFVVKDGVMRTPPKSPLMLPGITRDLVLELAQAHGLDCREMRYTASGTA